MCGLQRNVRVDVAAFKERYGITRKYAIPLLEYLDRERVTRRVGIPGCAVSTCAGGLLIVVLHASGWIPKFRSPSVRGRFRAGDLP
jgi:hypothetical protein